MLDIAALVFSCAALAVSCWSVWRARRDALQSVKQMPPAAPPPYHPEAGRLPVCYRTPVGIRVHGPGCQCPP